MILPEDIHSRIAEFMQGKRVFPFIKNDELICIFFLYQLSELSTEDERDTIVNMATGTVKRFDFEINKYKNSSKMMASDMIRDLYLKRLVQIGVEQAENRNFGHDQLLNDPMILSYCFSQHVSFYSQDYFFQIYGPLNEGEFLKEIRHFLQGAMVMLGFNRTNEITLPFKHPIIPLYIWLRDHQIRTKA